MVYYIGTQIITNNKIKKGTFKQAIEYLSRLDKIALDLECTGLHPWYDKPLLIGLGDKDNQFIIDCRSTVKEDVIHLFHKLENKTFIAHNMKYDYKFLAVHYKIRLTNVYCTMVASQVLYNGWDLSHSLDACLERHFKIKMDKSVRTNFINKPDKEAFGDEELLYLGDDITSLPQLKERQLKKSHEWGKDFLILGIEMKFLPILADIELRGFPFNAEKWIEINKANILRASKIADELKEELIRLHKQFPLLLLRTFDKKQYLDAVQQDLFNPGATKIGPAAVADTFNQKSVNHILKVFHRAMEVEIESTGEATLKTFLKEKYGHPLVPFIKLLLTSREVEKKVSTYGESFLQFINDATHRIHPNYTQAFTDTGRLSASDIRNQANKALKAFPPMQTIPSTGDYRACFIAPKGYKIMTIDLDGQEICVAANMSRDSVLMRSQTEGLDIHSLMANKSFNIILKDLGVIPYQEYELDEDGTITISKKHNKNLRNVHKPILFALFYGAGAQRIADVLSIPEDTAFKVHKALKKVLHGLMKHQAKIKQEVAKTTRVIFNTRTNRDKYFHKYVKGIEELYKVEKAACNAPIQGTSADMVKEAIINIEQDYLKLLRVKYPEVGIVGQLHDEIEVIIPADKAKIHAEKIRKIMCDTADLYLDGLHMTAGVNIKDYWEK